MIQFRARMYNVTVGDWVESLTTYTIGHYIDTWTPTENPFINNEGQTISLPRAAVSYNYGNNIGRAFEYYAKVYYNETGIWPVLRLCTSTGTDDYYIEWSHNSPNDLKIKAQGVSTLWGSIFQWENSVGTGGDVITCRSMVFVTAYGISDLNTEGLVFGGACKDADSESLTTLIAYNGFTLSTSAAIVSAAGEALVSVGGSAKLIKSAQGPAIAFTGAAGLTSGYIFYALFGPRTPGLSSLLAPWNVDFNNYGSIYNTVTTYQGVQFTIKATRITPPSGDRVVIATPIEYYTANSSSTQWAQMLEDTGTTVTYQKLQLYQYLNPPSPPTPPGPDPSDVDPDNPPDPDEPPDPIPPDDQDPYYDPTSDPDNPEYDPTKDPDNPEYDPTDPKDPFRPPSTEGGGDPEVKPPVDPVEPPPVPPPHAINSRFVTLYTPSLSQLNALAEYLWSPAWSIDGFKKIFANPMDCILGLMIFPALAAPTGSKEVNVGNLSTGVTMSYIDNQYVELNCGSFEITEYYASYLDYDPYTKIEIYLPYIGTHRLSADDVMAKTIQLKYMIDLLSGACVAFLVVDGTTLYTFTGSCATPIPVSGNDWSNMVNGILSVAGAATAAVISGGTAATMAAGAVASTSLFVSSHKEHIRHGGSVASAAGLMSIQTPYLIVTRPRQALPIGQNSFQGYPSFMTESLGSLTGYTEVESCHLEHIPCTDEELKEIERLLKGGVLF